MLAVSANLLLTFLFWGSFSVNIIITLAWTFSRKIVAHHQPVIFAMHLLKIFNTIFCIFRTNCSSSERSILMCLSTNRTNAGKNQMPRAGFEPTTPRSHERSSKPLSYWGHHSGWSRILVTNEHRLPAGSCCQAFAPRPLRLGSTSVDRRDESSSDQML